jgi:hypothetical protein
MISIYTISHPITEAVVYVGKTSDIELRAKSHLMASHNSKVKKFVIALSKNDLSPIFNVIDTCDDELGTIRERKWIMHYADAGCELFNGTHAKESRKTRQVNLFDSEYQEIFTFGGDPNMIGSFGQALRTVIERHKDQINTIEALRKHLKQLHERYDSLSEPETRKYPLTEEETIKP